MIEFFIVVFPRGLGCSGAAACSLGRLALNYGTRPWPVRDRPQHPARLAGIAPRFCQPTTWRSAQGGAAALVFNDKRQRDAGAGFGTPNVWVARALRIENGSRGRFAGWFAAGDCHRGRTQVAVVQASVNLDFFGIGHDPLPRGSPRSDKLDTTAGVGFGCDVRYEIARKYGLHMGLDVAHGPDGTAWYVQFGSAGCECDRCRRAGHRHGIAM